MSKKLILVILALFVMSVTASAADVAAWMSGGVMAWNDKSVAPRYTAGVATRINPSTFVLSDIEYARLDGEQDYGITLGYGMILSPKLVVTGMLYGRKTDNPNDNLKDIGKLDVGASLTWFPWRSLEDINDGLFGLTGGMRYHEGTRAWGGYLCMAVLFGNHK